METRTRPAEAPPVHLRGVKLLHDPVRNKGTAFTEDERDALGLRGLLPPRVTTQELQVRRALENLAGKNTDLERYIYLVSLQDRNERLFYRVLGDHLKELMPIVYTPTVGQACQQYGHIFRRPRGLFVSADDRGRVREVLRNWPHRDVRVVVVTDGERILGLGDLGAAGMAIPVGKLVLYTACAGIPPTQCLPVTLDVGTENEELLADPLYIGLPRRRLRGAEYDALVEEFLEGVREVFPDAVVQLEDFANRNAFRLLETYRERQPLFDDDIQGTGSVVLAGVLSALRLTGDALADQRFVFLGAGEASVGIASLIVDALVADGVPRDEARTRCWLVDSKGLVVAGRDDLAEHKRAFAHDHAPVGTLLEAVRALRPTALLGASGVAGAFDEPVLRAMTDANERPLVMALSNPTSRSECTARQAYAWTDGRAVFASGSPFDPVDHGGHLFVPGQANNAFIFPGVGLGALVSRTRSVTGEMFFVAARTLAGCVSDGDLSLGRLYPSFDRVREVSAEIAAAVAEVAWERGLARAERPANLAAAVRAGMFDPRYDADGDGTGA